MPVCYPTCTNPSFSGHVIRHGKEYPSPLSNTKSSWMPRRRHESSLQHYSAHTILGRHHIHTHVEWHVLYGQATLTDNHIRVVSLRLRPSLIRICHGMCGWKSRQASACLAQRIILYGKQYPNNSQNN